MIDDFEFVWMLRGQARVTFDEGDLPLAPGHLLLVPPGVRHALVWDQLRTSRHGYVHFEPRSRGRRLALGERTCPTGSAPSTTSRRAPTEWPGGHSPSVLDHPGLRLLSHLVWD